MRRFTFTFIYYIYKWIFVKLRNKINYDYFTTYIEIREKKERFALFSPVHEDDLNDGIRLPRDFFPVCHEDLSQWRTPLTLYEPEDPLKIVMYPKAKVYADLEHNVEYSIEEVTNIPAARSTASTHWSVLDTSSEIPPAQ